MKKLVLLVSLLVWGWSIVFSQEEFTEFLVHPMVALRMPVQGDSVNMSGKKMEAMELMKGIATWKNAKSLSTRVASDTAGYFSLAKVSNGYGVYVASTRMRAEHFLKGTLKISSPARFELFVNGVSKYIKQMVEDSLESVRPVTIALRMEPEADYEIVMKILSVETDRLAPTWKCEFEKEQTLCDVACRITPDLPKRFSLATTAYGSRVRSVSLSPDGKFLLTRYADKYDEGRSRSYARLSEVKSGKTILPSVPEGARWMPKSNKLYYMLAGKYRKNVVAFDPVAMHEELLLEDVPDGNFTWSPTEDFLIYSFTEKGEQINGPLKRLLHPDDRIPNSRDRNYLVKYDPLTGLTERLTYGSHPVYLNDIAPDGKRILCTSSKSDITHCPFSLFTLFEIDLSTLQVDTLVDWDAYLGRASYSPDGRRLVITASPSFMQGIGKNCGTHPIANDFDTQAYLMDMISREVTPITRDFHPAVELLQWNRSDGYIYFNTTDKDCRHIYRYSPEVAIFERLPLQEDVIAAFSLAENNASVAAYVGGGNMSCGVAYLYDIKKKHSILLDNPMKPILDEIEWGKMEPWNFTSADGTLIEGMVCLPPDFNPVKKYPLIVYYYGGTTPTTRGMTSPYSPQLFASRNYVVYVIQPSGAIGYGQEFSARHVNAWGKRTADEIIEGTRKFCEEHPFVNKKKIGCLGASYGGFMTMYLQTKTDLFTAAVSHAGISNVTSYWGEGFWGYSYNSVAAADSYPWQNPDLFTEQGALFNADKIHTPLLLLHGTVDTNVPIGESIQLYNALKILGKPVEFISVEGENHFISDYKKRVLWHNTMMAWFARWLQDNPAWWNDLYPERNW